MPPIDVCNAVAVRTVFLLSLITPVCSMAQTPVSEPPPVEKSSDWHLSAYADLAYLLDFNFPENHLWRSRSTSQRVNELAPNMGFLNLTKEMTTDSRWRWKSASKAVTTQKPLAFLQDEPRVGGSDTLRHMQRANVSISPPSEMASTHRDGQRRHTRLPCQDTPHPACARLLVRDRLTAEEADLPGNDVIFGIRRARPVDF